MLPEALRFQVGLIDQISKPLGNIQRHLDDVTNTYRQGTHTMMAGAAGMVGAGFALQKALMPAIELDRALGEVKSLGVADDQLKTLTSTAMKFSVEYGKSATDFVAASYDIKSAMGDMSGDELAGVTRSSAILAAATKADTATITNYMGTMYSVFKDQADDIGKDNWAERVAGQTAKSVELFKTNGQGMSDAFKGVGALGKTHGVAMEEQMAILGMLQGSMSGSEAGTRYKAFLSGVVKAQDDLGISFTDSNGKMLPMFDIMNKLRNEFGELDSMEMAKLKKAFGSDQALLVITDLIGKTNDLKSNVSSLNDAANLDTAVNMAHSMTDQWERLEQGVFAVRTAFGAALLPALLPVISSLADGGMEIIEWTEMFPNLTKYIGFAAIGILTAAAAGGAFTLMMGVGKQAMAAYMLALKALVVVKQGYSALIKVLRVSLLALHMNMNIYGVKTKLVTAGQWLLNGAVSMSATIYGTATTALTWLGCAFMTGTMAALKFTAALLTNPVFLIAAGVTAAVVAVGALIYYWDDLKASFGDTTWFQVLEGAINLITLPFRTLFNFVSAGWQWVMSGFTDTSGFAFIGQMAEYMRNIFGSVFSWFTDKLAGIWESLKGLVDWVPGFGGEDESIQVKSKSVQRATPHAQIPQGGAAKSIANYQTSSTNYGGVAIYPTYMSDPQDMASELEMAAG
ncbi:phage tail tape measure protein [Vibrio cionasavignyae]|uniref:phage tail tape measure protein n=1 Tax=Vibrio cionasavignyae TaxID=2910252 RepID=UPI003D14CA77